MYYYRYFHDRLKTCQWSSLVSRENLIDTSVSHLKFKNSKYLKSWVLLRYFPSHLQYFNKYDKNRQCPYCLQHMVITVWLAHTPYQILYQLPMSWKKISVFIQNIFHWCHFRFIVGVHITNLLILILFFSSLPFLHVIAF